MTIIAKQYNEIFNKHFYRDVYKKEYTGSSHGDRAIVLEDTTVFDVPSETRVKIITEIMYRKPLYREELPETYKDDLDEFAYTMSGMVEWTTAKITTVTDEFVDIDGEHRAGIVVALRDSLNMSTSLKHDLSVYAKIRSLITLELHYLKWELNK